MTTIATTCVHCGTNLHLDPRFLDKNLRCPSCQGVFRVANISPASGQNDDEKLEAVVTRSDETPSPSEEAKETLDSPTLDSAPAGPEAIGQAGPRDEIAESAERAERGKGESGGRLERGKRRDAEASAGQDHVIGRYRVKRELGRGAFGVVYHGDDPVLKREVAIKLQSRSKAEGDPAAMLAEARAAARLRHPNIVAVHEVDMHEGRPFVVSELILGPTLAERMEEGEIDQREAATLVRDLARGLAHAHQQGLVHRDVKPGNVLLGEDDRPQLTDFGLAVDRRDEDQAREQAYSRSGTPAYLAPEQAGIGGVSVGPAADQYALGVTLFEMLTGERPHSGNAMEILRALEAADPPRARERNPRVGVDLDAICFKAMAHDAWNRYDSCADLADDLDRFLAGDLIRGRRIGLVERARHFSKRNPRVASWLAATVTTFLVLFVISTIFAVRGQIIARGISRDGRESSGTMFVPVDRPSLAGGVTGGDDWDLLLLDDETEPLDDESDLAAIERARWIGYSRKLNKAARSVEGLNLQVAHNLLQEVPEPYRHWEHQYLATAAAPPIHQWQLGSQFRGSTELLALPMGLRIAVVERPYSHPVPADELDTPRAPSNTQLPVSIYDLATGKPLYNVTIQSESSEVEDLKLCPLHTLPVFAFIDGRAIRFWNYEDSTELPRLEIPTSRLKFLTISSDDHWLAAYNEEAESVQFWDRESGMLIQSVPAPLQQVLFTPDSEWALFLTAAREDVVRYAPDGQILHGAEREVVKFSPSSMTASVMMTLPEGTDLVAVSQSMNELVVMDSSREMRLQPVFSGVPDQLIARSVPWQGWDGTRYPQELVSQLPMGETFVVVRRNNQVEIVQGENSYPVALPKNFPDISDISLHADGQLLVALVFKFGDDPIDSDLKMLVWDVRQVIRGMGNSIPQDAAVMCLAGSPDQRYLAVGLSNGELSLWDQETQSLEWSNYTQAAAPVPAAPVPSAPVVDSETDIDRDAVSASDVYDDWGGGFAPLSAVAYHPSGNAIATGNERGVISFWSADGGELLGTWPSVSRPVHALAYSPDGQLLVAGLSSSEGWANSDPADVILFASDDGSVVHRWQSHRTRVNSVAFHPSGDFVYSSGDDGQVIQWRLGSDTPVTIHTCSQGIPTELRVAPDGETLVFVATDGSRHVFETVVQQIEETVYKPVFETRTEEFRYIVCEPRTITNNFVCNSEGVLTEYERQETEFVSETRTGTRTYTVSIVVPETKVRTSSFPVSKVYQAVKCENPGSVLPSLVMLRADDLRDRGIWVPEGGRRPHSPRFSADGRRLFVSTDHGVSVLHPAYLFELVQLRPERDANATEQIGLGTEFPFLALSFSQRLGKLCVSSGRGLHWLASNREPSEEDWKRLASAAEAKGKQSRDEDEIGSSDFSGEDPANPPPFHDEMPNWISIASRGTFDLTPAEPGDGMFPADRMPTRDLAEVGPEEESVDLLTLNLDYSGPSDLPEQSSPRGLVTAPGGRRRLEIGGQWAVFSTQFRLAKDHHGALGFAIIGDGRTLFRSSILRDHQYHGIDIDVRGVQVLELVAERADRGQDAAIGVWISPALSRKVEETYALEFDELRIIGTELDLCEIKLSGEGLELTNLHFTDPTLHVNGHAWKPKSEPRLPNSGRTRFFSPDADFRRARIHAYGIQPQADLLYQYEEDGVRIQFSYPPVGSTQFELVVQVPRRLEGESREEVEPNWRAPWKVAGYAYRPEEHGAAPAEVPPKGTRAFAVDDLDEISWNWPSGRSPLRNTPQEHYIVIGQRAFQSEGGFYRIEAIGDDGVRVKVNDRVVIDHWKPGPVLQHSAMVRLEAGTHRIRFEQLKPHGKSRLGVSVRAMESNPFRRKDPPVIPVPRIPEEADAKPTAPTQIAPTPTTPTPAAPTPAAPTPTDEVLQAWEAAGFTVSWRWTDPATGSNYGYPQRNNGIPVFHASDWNDELLASLPDPSVPFGLELGWQQTVTDDTLNHLATWDQLKSLELSRWDVTDEGSQALPRIGGLTHLNIRSASIDDVTLAGIAHCQNLEILRLGNATISNDGLRLLGQLLKLQFLELRSPNVTDEGVRFLRQLPELKHLALRAKGLTDEASTYLAELRGLVRLSLTPGSFTDRGLEGLMRMELLESLEIAESEISDAGFGKLLAKEGLERLTVSNSLITGEGLFSLEDSGSLTNLTLSGCPVSDRGLEAIVQRLPQLKILGLSQTEITDEGLRHLSQLEDLYQISLYKTKVTDAGLQHLGTLDRLAYLTLTDTEVSDEGLRHLTGLERLRYVWAKSTKVTEQGAAMLREARKDVRVEHGE
jgi:WD40 repeat protein